MKYYMAPLEGITGYIFRNSHHQIYGPMDRYFAPFIVPTSEGSMRKREKRDVLPENNTGLPVIPQVLAGSAGAFVEVAKELEQLGYREVNLNLGCPSGTVVPKGKGAGALADPDRLASMLTEICESSPIPVSVKTRLGIEDPGEFRRLLAIYNELPLTEVIVHPRVLKEQYKGVPHRDVFAEALAESRHPMIYNGNLFTAGEIRELEESFPTMAGVMLGRGLVSNPGLADEARGLYPGAEEFRRFHELVYAQHKETQCGDRNLMFRMKELWFYMMDSFGDSEHMRKKLRKIQKAGEYEAWFRELMRTCPYDPRDGFHPPV